MTHPIHAPQLDSPLGWLNTDRPLRLAGELRGRVVVLDFWTYCCINCMHILPDLAFLEEKYAAQPVVFLGVHSAKFTNESDRETIRAAILRYEIKHPVVIDDRMKLWRAYAVRSWPTVVVVDSMGRVAVSLAGEGQREALDRAIGEALDQGRAAGTLADGPLTVQREASVAAASPLCFPGKVFADAELRRLFIADSNHNRIVIADWPDEQGQCRVVRVVGSGAVGADDGPAERATFNHPQGLVTGQGRLYVADTENHLIRAVDLENGSVTTVVGTGRMTYDFAGGAMGVDQGINSPWDVTREGSTLYVAMAGQHQVWRIDMPVGFARALAGTGRENLADGPTERAAFAQPSGICLHHGHLFIADSEVSAIRGIDLATERVYTVLGEGLFTFGDVDGAHPAARLQHPLGVSAWSSGLIVADTYNHKIKIVDPAGRSARTILGTGRPGTTSDGGGPMFFEPGGLSCAGDDLFIADTNNQRIVHINLTTRRWHVLVLTGLSAPSVGDASGLPAPGDAGCSWTPGGADDSTGPGSSVGKQVAAILTPLEVPQGRAFDLLLELQLPRGVHVSGAAPWVVTVESDGRAAVSAKGNALPIRVSLPPASMDGRTTVKWTVHADFVCCTEDDRGLCMPVSKTWRFEVRAASSAARQVTLSPRLSEADCGLA
ncbi:MAG: redoxin domain-containing protein [Phycisphaerales bacterium]|nr:redoxin domain-containing protein [Phycisphaerales bacterium]